MPTTFKKTYFQRNYFKRDLLLKAAFGGLQRPPPAAFKGHLRWPLKAASGGL